MDWKTGAIQQHGIFVWPDLRTVAATEAFTDSLADRYQTQHVTASRADLALAYEVPARVSCFQGGPNVDIAPVATINEHATFAGLGRELAAKTENAGGYGEAEAASLFERLFSRRMRVAAFVPPRE